MIETQIRQLAARKESKGPFVTLYLDTLRRDESQRDRIRVFLKNEVQKLRDSVGGNGQQASLENAIKQIEEYVENSLEPGTRGVVIFSCPTDNFFNPIQLPVPVQPELRIGSKPHLRQLAELRQQYPNVLVAMVDGKSARLFQLGFGQILSEIDLEDPDMPRRHDQGGWSQSNLQRHVQDHVDKHHKEVADVVSKLIQQGKAKTLILSGQDRNVANFRSFLPKNVDALIAGTLHLEMRSSAEEIVAAAHELLEARRNTEVASRIGSLQQPNGRTALGSEAVAEAVNQKKIDQLFVSRRADAKGWKCSSCSTVGVQIPLGCPACGANVNTIDLIDEFISAAHLEDALVECVIEHPILEKNDGVGAILRF